MDRNRLIGTITPGGSTAPGAAGRVTALAVAAELSRITPRDRLILDLLADHQTLTTGQLTEAAFGTIGRARVRLTTLHRRDILDRFRHYQRPGSQAWRWVLGPLGAAIVAAGRGEPLPRPAAVRDATARLATSPMLGHLLGVNGFFVALMAHARTDDSVRLLRWWNEARCREAAGNLVRPDGHGVWAVSGRRVSFWLEHDTGTEALRRVVVGKLDGYAHLAGTRWALPVLFWLPTATREANLHTLLTGAPAAVTVATASADYATGAGGPAARVWHVPGRPGRVRLAEVPYAIPDGAPWDG